MVRNVMMISFFAALSVGAAAAFESRDRGPALQYPETKKVDQADDYHGTNVADPYRWLEDLDSDETADWVKRQNKVTFGYLDRIPEREQITRRLTELWDYPKFGTPWKTADRYFFFKNDGLQNQSVLYTTDALSGKPRELLDPNTLSDDGTTSVGTVKVNDDASLMVYGVSEAGSDWVEYRVRDIATGKDRDDVIKWVKFSDAAWDENGDGFFYSRYDEPKQDEDALETANYFHKLYYHKLGTPQSEDKLIYERPDEKEWGFGGEVTEDGKYLVIGIWQGTERKNRVYLKNLEQEDAKVVPLLDEFDASYEYIDNDGSTFFFKTDNNAPRGRVVAIDINKPAAENWREVVPQAAETLEQVDLINDRFVAVYLKDARTAVRTYAMAGGDAKEIELPGIGAASGFTGKRSATETFYSFSTFTAPPTIYRYDFETGKSELYKRPQIAYDPDRFETKQVFYNSKDGTRIPMFITAKKGVNLDGRNPTFLYGYGGFDIPITPRFSPANIVWMEMGGIYAVANIRGGGEYGKEWHDAGRLKNKQNVFDDFIAAGEWLVTNKYTVPAKLAIHGRSNGGLLVGACMTQRPDLFAAAVPGVGVLDMLRFQHFTIGWAWVSDYGDSKNADDFRVQYAYSPLHNLKKGTRYPSTLITTGDHDDRVVPSHSFKFAAALQEAHAGNNPVLIRIETDAGHGAGKPTSKQIEENADILAFLVHELDINVPASFMSHHATMSSD